AHPCRRQRAPADGLQGDEPPLLSIDRHVRQGHRRPGSPEHVLQPEGGAHSQHAGERVQYLQQERNGPPGAGQLRREQGVGPAKMSANSRTTADLASRPGSLPATKLSAGRRVLLQLGVAFLILLAGEAALRIWAGFFRHSYQRYDSELGMIGLLPNFDEK